MNDTNEQYDITRVTRAVENFGIYVKKDSHICMNQFV